MVAHKQANGVQTDPEPFGPEDENTAGKFKPVTPGTLVKAQRFDDDTLAGIASFADALALIGGDDNFIDAADLGAGFALLPTSAKQLLVGVPLLILEWSFHPGSAGEFVSCRVVTQDGRKLIINDGSTGIFDQLNRVSVKLMQQGRPLRGVVCKHGLRASRYKVMVPDPKTGEDVETEAITFYLDTSA